MMSDNMATSLKDVENCHFSAVRRAIPSKFDIVIPRTPLSRYGGIAQEKSMDFANFQVLIPHSYTCVEGISMMP